MDPLTALSLAGTVVQFVDFAAKLFSEGRELYKSSTGNLAVNEELELITSAFGSVLKKLKTADEIATGSSAVKDERQVRVERIRREAEQIASELIKLLDTLKIQSKNDNHRVWQSAKQAIKSTRSKGEIAKLEERLERFQKAVNTEFIIDIR